MKRVIIIEGPDNIGKTTLAKAIAKKFTGSIEHCGPPQGKTGKTMLAYNLRKLDETLAKLEENDEPQLEIWDRSIIGEAVYGPLYRAEKYDHSCYYEELTRLTMYNARVMVIVLYADEQTIEKFELKPKGDENELYQKASQTKKIAVKFVDVATKLGMKHTLFVNSNNYETLDDRNDYVTKRIETWLKRKPFTFTRTNDYGQTFFNRTQRLWVKDVGFNHNHWECEVFDAEECEIAESHRKLKMFGGGKAKPIGGVGAFDNIRYLFVGESTGYNTSVPEQLGMPFYNGESGCLFQTALGVLKIFPTQYYLTNVVKCNPKDNKLGNFVTMHTRSKLECVDKLKKELSAFTERNTRVKVVAIGKVAAEELARLRIDHVMSYHPSYYLRMGRSDDFITDFGKVLS